MDDSVKDHIVMTPKKKTANSTTLAVERQTSVSDVKKSGNVHVAGGDHRGIVINKQLVESDSDTPAQLSLEFRVFLVSGQTGMHTQESRILQFWFVPNISDTEQASVAQAFFKELVSPQEFPRDYVGFIKKVMKLLQHGYRNIKKVEVTLTQLDEIEAPPNRPFITKLNVRMVSADENSVGAVAILSEEKVLELLESAYPNPVTVVDMAQENGWLEEDVVVILATLQEKGLVKPLEHGVFTRVGQGDTEIQVVKQMPSMARAKQPTIAVITVQYCEKLAVDAMMENKETFVRYTTVGSSGISHQNGKVVQKTRFGESNVYTLGNIGAHQIVCTKLPTVGHTREAMTAAGNTTTRLLGTFQEVDYVFLVGVGGGVPHFTDYNKHVRLGDVVVSFPVNGHKYVYIYCENTKTSADGSFEFETKAYSPANPCLQEIAAKLKSQVEGEEIVAPWTQYLQEGLSSLRADSEQDFSQPPPETDKLYMSIGDRDLIEVAHPAPLDGTSSRSERVPKLHLSPVASGRAVAREDQLRQLFSDEFGALAFDSEFDAVVESVIGNCRDSFVCLRGISDYKDGTRRKEWQPYASLVAASVMKTIICGMDPPSDV